VQTVYAMGIGPANPGSDTQPHLELIKSIPYEGQVTDSVTHHQNLRLKTIVRAHGTLYADARSESVRAGAGGRTGVSARSLFIKYPHKNFCQLFCPAPRSLPFGHHQIPPVCRYRRFAVTPPPGIGARPPKAHRDLPRPSPTHRRRSRLYNGGEAPSIRVNQSQAQGTTVRGTAVDTANSR